MGRHEAGRVGIEGGPTGTGIRMVTTPCLPSTTSAPAQPHVRLQSPRHPRNRVSALNHLGIPVDAALVAALGASAESRVSGTLHATSGGHKGRIYEPAMMPNANTLSHDERPDGRREKAPHPIGCGAFVM